MDEKGRKMSKSLGNVIDPQDVIKNYGADILRLWVASVDYTMDIKVGDTMFKQLSDIYRNLRNTSRYMLGNLFDFDPTKDTVACDQLWDLDRLILHKLQILTKELTEHFDNYQFFKYYQLLQNFCSVELSSFYFDIIKDRLYTHGTNSVSRRAAQTVLAEILAVTNRLFVPVLPHLAEDIYQFTPAAVKSAQSLSYQHSSELDTVLISKWPSVNAQYVNDELAAKWTEILALRETSNKAIEELRKQGVIGKSLEASVSLGLDAKQLAKITKIQEEVKAVFIVSELKLCEAQAVTAKAEKFDGTKCVRCWKLFKQAEIHEGICTTCTSAIKTP
jgi:isoleucyl-tRNA synthetase